MKKILDLVILSLIFFYLKQKIVNVNADEFWEIIVITIKFMLPFINEFTF